jgi:hypothetical protein
MYYYGTVQRINPIDQVKIKNPIDPIDQVKPKKPEKYPASIHEQLWHNPESPSVHQRLSATHRAARPRPMTQSQ